MRSIRQIFLCLTAVVVMTSLFPSSLAQTRSANKRRQGKAGSHSSSPRVTMTPEARLLLEQAMDAVCTQQKLDPQSNIPIDEMQARPSLPIHSPEAEE
ncbi:MAG TPA: hypothetical protein VGP98_08145, partial [Pyrinomonadaceae bacterium]|nr:hypothetical protein [Pyrinomonadaceae bacterium]